MADWDEPDQGPAPWRSRPATLSPGPAPTGRDKVFDSVYGWLGGKPENRWAADKLTDVATLGGMAPWTAAYDGGRELAETGRPAALATALIPGARVAAPVAKAAEKAVEKGIRAFHGSPHDFDRFDLSKINTGEGAQAYGHGLYFAEAEPVAAAYRQNLTKGARTGEGRGRTDVFFADGQELPASQKQISDVAHMMREFNIDPATPDGADWLGREVGARGLPWETAEQAMALARRNLEKKTMDGRMYEVNIKADPEDFLDWDKPLSQQSERVREAVRSVGLHPDGAVPSVDEIAALEERSHAARKVYDDLRAEYFSDAWKNPAKSEAGFDSHPGAWAAQNEIMKAHDAINAAVRARESETGKGVMERALDARDLFGVGDGSSAQAASRRLREAGIPGIRYLDQGSRGAGEGSRNLVVFDDSLIDIVRKYGIAGLLAAYYGGSPSQADAKTPQD